MELTEVNSEDYCEDDGKMACVEHTIVEQEPLKSEIFSIKKRKNDKNGLTMGNHAAVTRLNREKASVSQSVVSGVTFGSKCNLRNDLFNTCVESWNNRP